LRHLVTQRNKLGNQFRAWLSLWIDEATKAAVYPRAALLDLIVESQNSTGIYRAPKTENVRKGFLVIRSSTPAGSLGPNGICASEMAEGCLPSM
jgi:hypothetical protein